MGLRLDEDVPLSLVKFLGQQIGAAWSVFQDYARRDATRRQHFGEAAGHLGLRVCTIEDRRHLLACAANEAMSTDKSSTIITALLQYLRDNKIVLPAPSSVKRPCI